MTGRSSPALAVVATAVGGLLVLLTSGRQWAHTSLPGAAGQLSVSGHQVSAAIPAIAYALLALAVAILASSGPMRRVVGGVVALLGILTVVTAVTARGHVAAALADQEQGAIGRAVHASANGWWVVTLLGGVVALAAGMLTLLRSGAWSRMGAKYDAPTAPRPARDPAAVTWDALDRGEDPTE